MYLLYNILTRIVAATARQMSIQTYITLNSRTNVPLYMVEYIAFCQIPMNRDHEWSITLCMSYPFLQDFHSHFGVGDTVNAEPFACFIITYRLKPGFVQKIF